VGTRGSGELMAWRGSGDPVSECWGVEDRQMNSLSSEEMPTEVSWSMALVMASLLSSKDGARISTKRTGPCSLPVVRVLKRGRSFFERASAAWLNCRRLWMNLMGVCDGI